MKNKTDKQQQNAWMQAQEHYVTADNKLETRSTIVWEMAYLLDSVYASVGTNQLYEFLLSQTELQRTLCSTTQNLSMIGILRLCAENNEVNQYNFKF